MVRVRSLEGWIPMGSAARKAVPLAQVKPGSQWTTAYLLLCRTAGRAFPFARLGIYRLRCINAARKF